MKAQPASNDSAGTGTDWRKLIFNQDILAESTAEGGRLVLWLPGSRSEKFQHWERVSIVPYAEFTLEPGIFATAATGIEVRRPLRGFLGKLLARFRPWAEEERAWLLPNRESAEQVGESQTDLILVWVEDAVTPLDETWIRSRWPDSNRCQRLGEKLFLVSGVEPPAAGNLAAAAQSPACPRQLAEQLLATARQSGNPWRKITALTDLGIIYLHEGNPRRALPFLEEALSMVRQLGDRTREAEVLGNLGLANLALGQAEHALELFEQELVYARRAGDRFAEKLALEHLGLAWARLRDPVRALQFFEPALALARQLGHRKHQADLLWYIGIQHAELGQRDQAMVQAQAAIELLEKMHSPQAAWFADHLHRYRSGETQGGLGGKTEPGRAASPEVFWGGSVVVNSWDRQPGLNALARRPLKGPSLLRMAISASKSMVKFLGSGLQSAPAAILQRRLRTCAACPHHTGLRCRLCGCFTHVKARMAHEECPIGKWGPG